MSTFLALKGGSEPISLGGVDVDPGAYAPVPTPGSTVAETQEFQIAPLPGESRYSWWSIYPTAQDAQNKTNRVSTSGLQAPGFNSWTTTGWECDGSSVVLEYVTFSDDSYSDQQTTLFEYVAHNEGIAITPANGSTLSSVSQLFSMSNVPSDKHWDYKAFASEADADALIAETANPQTLDKTPVMEPSSAHAATLNNLGNNGSQTYIVFSYYDFDGDVTYENVVRIKFTFTAHTATSGGALPHSHMQGLGTLVPIPPSMTKENRTSRLQINGQSNQTLTPRYLNYVGDSGKGNGNTISNLLLYDCHNLIIEGWLFVMPGDSNFVYHRYSGGNGTNIQITVHSSCTNITIRGNTFYGGISAISDSGDGTQIYANAIGRSSRNIIIFNQSGPSSDRNLVADENIIWCPAFEQNSLYEHSIDNINFYTWKEPNSGEPVAGLLGQMVRALLRMGQTRIVIILAASRFLIIIALIQ